MNDRLPTGLLVAALRRLVEEAGGNATILARGDIDGGTILVVIAEPGAPERLVERGMGGAGQPVLIESTPADGDVTGYWRKRRARDPDLWVIELNVPQAERFVAETMLIG